MRKKHFAVFGIAFAVLALSMPAMANFLSGATATADCSGYILTVNAIDLTPTTVYTIDYTFTLTCGGSSTPVTGSITFTADSTGSATVMKTGTWPGAPLTTNCTVGGGSATLTSSSSTVPITFSGSGSFGLICIVASGGCPATIGFWKNQDKHPFPSSVQSGGLTIGGVTYSQSDLYTILNNNGGNAVVILGKQLVGALLNLAAGAKHNAGADAAITTAETLLSANSLNLLTSVVNPSSALGQALLADASVLDGYNGGDFNTCSESTGLILGP